VPAGDSACWRSGCPDRSRVPREGIPWERPGGSSQSVRCAPTAPGTSRRRRGRRCGEKRAVRPRSCTNCRPRRIPPGQRAQPAR
jgi:hypothetical protein